jgi:hypothetical protein
MLESDFSYLHSILPPLGMEIGQMAPENGYGDQNGGGYGMGYEQ